MGVTVIGVQTKEGPVITVASVLRVVKVACFNNGQNYKESLYIPIYHRGATGVSDPLRVTQETHCLTRHTAWKAVDRAIQQTHICVKGKTKYMISVFFV